MFASLGYKRILDKLMLAVFFTAGFITIFITIGIVYVLLADTLEFFKEVSIKEFLTEKEWTPVFATKKFGIWPLIAGTFLIAAIAMIVSVPLGLLIAIYLSEYASVSVKEIAKPIIEFLEAVPTVVYGYFTLLFVTPLLQKIVPDLESFNSLAPGVVLGFMILPYTASMAEDAMKGVPQRIREASYALGATKLWTAIRIILPASISGVIAGFILGASRAIGETMVVAISAGMYPNLTLDPREPIQTMTGYIVQIALGDLPFGSIEYLSIFAVGFTLFIIAFVFNSIALWLKSKIREMY
ncbi:MAG: phosphate ABC transporter permease subunit PstC [Thermodesulfovibrio sp.]|uniref:phosphate ABC transporter permease subunit PstC n=1 Tax=unclassified Thermodesulfovibrio TaxID=2645936 RepID=UPI00083B07CA|nr:MULTISPECIES: phosphate ABC transporter permease subunit PstC [unclassified Thermodesulfovibrio]MDI1472080.1 phosphate ABC transporter permease subunit PstC [Thermodesulfovibrio sp. 1176]MDI6713768.1 phosphate ABC transporter permease subunit PstC [Thermodesulfovibrio sp.]ODA45162.1 Phosphate transport system permease protein PstC [Thermodesulfovibrio sp. N1]